MERAVDEIALQSGIPGQAKGPLEKCAGVEREVEEGNGAVDEGGEGSGVGGETAVVGSKLD